MNKPGRSYQRLWNRQSIRAHRRILVFLRDENTRPFEPAFIRRGGSPAPKRAYAGGGSAARSVEPGSTQSAGEAGADTRGPGRHGHDSSPAATGGRPGFGDERRGRRDALVLPVPAYRTMRQGQS